MGSCFSQPEAAPRAPAGAGAPGGPGATRSSPAAAAAAAAAAPTAGAGVAAAPTAPGPAPAAGGLRSRSGVPIVPLATRRGPPDAAAAAKAAARGLPPGAAAAADSAELHSMPLTGAPRAGSSNGQQRAVHMEFLTQVQELQQQMAMVSTNPLLGLAECAELLAAHLGADLVSIYLFPEEPKGEASHPRAVLMAAHGIGAPLLQRCIVSGDRDSAPLAMRATGALAEHIAGEGRPLPPDLELLHDLACLNSFTVVPIGPPATPAGALLLGRNEAAPLPDDAQLRLHVASISLLQHAHGAAAVQVAQLLRVMDQTQDPVALISVLLRSTQRYMAKTAGMRMSARLALLQWNGCQEALMFELPTAGQAGTPTNQSSSGAHADGAPVTPRHHLALPGDASADVTATTMELANTLLASAVTKQQARFINDVSSYMQSSAQPARDIFTRLTSELVSSLVVVPLVSSHGGAAAGCLGALYLTYDAPCEWDNVQEPLLGFIHAVTQMLHNKLAGRSDLLVAVVAQAQRRASVTSTRDGATDAAISTASLSSEANQRSPVGGPRPHRGVSPPPALERAGSITRSGTPTPPLSTPNMSGTSMAAGGGDGTPQGSRLLHVASAKRLNTEAMLKLVQQEIRSTRRRTAELSVVPELVVRHCLGKGGFGTVYKGYWHKVAVAVKVLPARKSEHEAMKDAVEMAVLSSVQHPNIVAVYSCLTDMVEVTDGADANYGSLDSSVCEDSAPPMRFRRLMPEEDGEGEALACNILVMDYCDRGSLQDAVRQMAFHAALPNGAVGVDFAAVVDVLQDVAYAVQYVHSMQLVHGDIKLENILLKSDAGRRLGFTPKLADFGLSRVLGHATGGAVNVSGAGTVTHLAPEMFQAGSRVTTAVDVYAFGIFMYELYTRKRAYSGMAHSDIIERVYKEGMRPRFPSATPPAYAALAEACWATDPGARPAFAGPGGVVPQLEALVGGVEAAAS